MANRIVHNAPGFSHWPFNTGDGVEGGDNPQALVNNINSNFSELFSRLGGNQSTSSLGPNTTALAGGGSGTFKPTGNLSTQLSITGAGNPADTFEDTLFSYVMPAGTFDQAGRGISIQAFGFTANNGNTKTIKVYFGGTSFSLGAVSAGNVNWDALVEVYRTDSINNQVGFGTGEVGGTRSASSRVKPTETESGAITIKVTGQSGSAGASDIVCHGLVVSFMD